MATDRQLPAAPQIGLRGSFVGSKAVQWIGLLALCSAYIQGPITKLLDFNGALAEMDHFGLRPTHLFAIAVIIFELAMSAAILIGFFRWVAALALGIFTLMATLLALRFWELPLGSEHTMAMNGFFEHLGLAGAFLLVAWHDLHRKISDLGA